MKDEWKRVACGLAHTYCTLQCGKSSGNALKPYRWSVYFCATNEIKGKCKNNYLFPNRFPKHSNRSIPSVFHLNNCYLLISHLDFGFSFDWLLLRELFCLWNMLLRLPDLCFFIICYFVFQICYYFSYFRLVIFLFFLNVLS